MFFFNGNLISGDTIELPVNSVALLYGATVFTTLRVYNGCLDHPLTHWQQHCDRTSNSIREFGWKMPNWQKIKQEAQELSNYFPVLRITIFPNGQELILGRQLPNHLSIKQLEGVKGKVITNNQLKRSLPLHKTGNYLAPYLALEGVKKENFHEAILTDDQENWLETSTGNLWGYVNHGWFTPSLREGILGGIARKFILENADFPIQENVWHPNFIKTLSAIVYSNSVVEIVPFKLITIGKQIIKFDPTHHAIKQLKILYHNNS